MATTREIIVEILNNSTAVRNEGLPRNEIYQADTVDSPESFPFVVVRWLDEVAGVGAIRRRPFDLWVYDSPGDYGRAERIGRAALKELDAVVQEPNEGGYVLVVETKGTGLGQGADLYDDGFDAIVIPFRAVAVASGL